MAHGESGTRMDLSPAALVLIALLILAMLAWAYFDGTSTGTA
ncbi:MAG: hypothetical protein AVDCRST_MAG18-1430 [uncultured Thermomicrobiales bacterium]|uniref:Uncharacterized protein n=1 Tax=uncultured Thermomicrobiales bacterium TaxID=1645740 RepID=A0A6J4V0Y3_9BACT|nr:MAG: hypothetical protein AVDCRST_MAG18-1430 [uncultured Thermomicrobiales bacterium]